MKILNTTLNNFFNHKFFVIFCSRSAISKLMKYFEKINEVDMLVDKEGFISFNIKKNSKIEIKELNIISRVINKTDEINKKLIKDKHNLKLLKEKENLLITIQTIKNFISDIHD